MKTRMGSSAFTLLVGCVFGLVVGTVIFDRSQRVAFAKTAASAQAANDGKLRIIIFGAHPDDAEYRGAGVAMKWAKLGHHVKLVSATNGDIGHWRCGERRKCWPWASDWALRPRCWTYMMARSCLRSRIGARSRV